MKNSLKAILLCASLLLAGRLSAQTPKDSVRVPKIGHIDTGKLLKQMPQIDSADKKLASITAQYQDELKRMSEDYQRKEKAYVEEKDRLQPALREMREKELMDLQGKIQNFQETASQDLEEIQRKLMEPIIKIAKDAITEVAKEKGYTYVFDTSAGSLLYWPDSDDLLPAVKLKLRIYK